MMLPAGIGAGTECPSKKRELWRWLLPTPLARLFPSSSSLGFPRRARYEKAISGVLTPMERAHPRGGSPPLARGACLHAAGRPAQRIVLGPLTVACWPSLGKRGIEGERREELEIGFPIQPPPPFLPCFGLDLPAGRESDWYGICARKSWPCSLPPSLPLNGALGTPAADLAPPSIPCFSLPTFRSCSPRCVGGRGGEEGEEADVIAVV